MQDIARALIEKEVGLEAEETFIQSPTIYIPSSPDYARAVSSGIAWGLIPEAQCAEELESGHLVKLATTPVEFPLYWQRWNINSPVMETVTRRVHEAARGDLIY